MKKILVLAIFIMSLITVVYGADNLQNYDIDINIGNQGMVYIDKKIPITIAITNNASDFDGTLRVLIPLETNSNEKSYYSYDYMIQIPSKQSKKIEVIETPDIMLKEGLASIQLLDKNNNVLYKKDYKIRKSYEMKSSIGILSDDFDSMSYIKSTNSYDLVNLKDINLEVENVFSMYDVIFINFYETNKLSDKSIKSLEKFVTDGGSLVIGTGQYKMKSIEKLDFIGNVEIENTIKKSSLELESITDIKIKQNMDIELSNIIADDFEQINNLILKKTIGKGNVVISKIAFNDDVFKSYIGSDNFINTFVKYDNKNMIKNDRNNFNYNINNYISKIPKIFMPNPVILSVFIFVFVVLIGPVTYIVLSHFDKRDYGFIVILIIVIVSIGGIKLYGYSLNSNSDIVNQLSFLKADGNSFIVDNYIGFKGSKGDVDIAFDKKYSVSKFSLQNYSLESGHIYSKYSDDENHIIFHNSKQWEFNNIKIDTVDTFDEDLISNLTVGLDNIKLNFKNNIGYNMNEVFLVYGNRIFYKSDLEKNTTFEFDKKISSLDTFTENNVANSIYGYSSVLGLTQDYLKNDILTAFFASIPENEKGAFLLMSTDEYGIDIKNNRNKKEQKLAYIFIPLKLEFEKNLKSKVTSGVIKEKIIDSSGIVKDNYSYYYNGNGSITLGYEIPSSIELEMFEFDFGMHQNEIQYEIYNVKTKLWEKIDVQNLKIPNEKISNYYSDNIKIRIGTSNYIDFESPKFMFEGVGK